jgi:hypothetical protein
VVLSVTTLAALRTPVSALNVTVIPDNMALEEFKALTVIFEVVEPSEFIDAGEAERLIESAVGVVGVIGVVPESLLPPQATRQQNRAKKISSNAGRENFTLIDFIILISFL